MPKGKGTYGTKKGRPSKKQNHVRSSIFHGRMKPKHGTGLRYQRFTMTVKLKYRGVTYTKTIKD